MEPIIGMIMLWPVPWVPQGWLACEGQTLPVSEYMALYSLIGPTYGGDGVNTFKLPDLRGRVPVGSGSGPGLPHFQMGTAGGDCIEQIALSVSNLPSHTHEFQDATVDMPASTADVNIKVSTDDGERDQAQNNDYLAKGVVSGRPAAIYRGEAINSVNLAGTTATIPASSVPVTGHVGMTGHGESVLVKTMQPFLTIRYIIAWQGIYPQRP